MESIKFILVQMLRSLLLYFETDLPRSDSAIDDDSFETLGSGQSDADTMELHLYEHRNIHRRIGMSDVTTIVVRPESHISDVYVEDSDSNEAVHIDPDIYEFIANSVFAFSLFKDDVQGIDFIQNDNPDCYICKSELFLF